MARQAFPKNFLWGASVAAHQVEGGNHNQWTEWEQKRASHLAATAERRYHWMPSWQTIKDLAVTPENYISGIALDHYHLYKEDFKLLKQLNMNAFRFSIEWSRIEPEEGKWDERAIEYYREYLRELKRLSIEPIVTLWHWTVPVWFSKKGEFAKRGNIKYFERFVAKIAAELGDEFRRVVILNEPNVHVSESYWLRTRPPQRHSVLLAGYVYYNLALAHRRAYRIMKRARPRLHVGIAMAMADAEPANPKNLLDQVAMRFSRYASNWWFLDRVRRRLDFVGVNYYFTTYINWRGKVRNPSRPLNDMGWYMEPKGLRLLLVAAWRRYHKPIIITENGLADARDAHRQWWLEETITAMQDALQQGVDLRGYLHWSLLDNFEWEKGFWPNFGLIAVDRQTMERTIRPSAKWLAAFLREE